MLNGNQSFTTPIAQYEITSSAEEAVRFFEPRQLHDKQGTRESPDTYFRYINLEKGEEYSIGIKNTSGSRMLFCVGVDGRSVVNGARIPSLRDAASRKAWSDSNGYVISDEHLIRGWRESLDVERQFIVTDALASYSAEVWDDSSAMGTICIAVFREDTSYGSGMRGMRGGGDLGTGYAARVASPVGTTVFNSKTCAYELLVLKYATAKTLKSLGIYVESPKTPEDSNRIWPAEQKFCKFPQG